VDLSAPLNLTRRTRVYAAGAEASNKWNGGADARAYFSIREPSGVNKRRRMMYSVSPPSVIRSEPEFTVGRNAATVVTATSDGICQRRSWLADIMTRTILPAALSAVSVFEIY